MKERPILFSAPMVRALLDGSKTQTRRVVAMPRSWDCIVYADFGNGWWPYRSDDGESPNHDNNEIPLACPYGQPGDRLWVRESGWISASKLSFIPSASNTPPPGGYLDPDGVAYKSCPSIHMPRWSSRIDLEVTGVRVERLQDISEADADAEGCERLDSEREEHDWKLCPQCGGTRLYTSLGPNMGACFDTDCMNCDTYVKRYQHLWEAINGAGSWAANPWVWVVEFRRMQP